MIGYELVLKFHKNEAFLTDDFALSFDEVELGELAKKRGFKNRAFWLIEVLIYEPTEGRINVKVLSYNNGETNFSPFQKSIANELKNVRRIIFKGIDTHGLLNTLDGSAPFNYIPPKKNINNESCKENSYYYNTNVRKKINFASFEKYTNEIKIEPPKTYINETFYIPIKKVRFQHERVSFDKKFDQLKNTIELTIQNDNIKEEFDAVKNYFANVLNTKKIQVKVSIVLSGDQITSIEANSPEVEKINKEIIETVKFEFVKKVLKKKIPTENDKTLFTLEEYFNNYSDGKVKMKTFYSKEQDLLNDLLRITNTKHYRHLRFLSSRHAYDTMKLRFILKPDSFVFLIEGTHHCHFIWETLNTSEATYIWHAEKDKQKLPITFRKIEEIINLTRVQGKTAYISSNEDKFRRIYHDYSDINEGFIKWKGELENVLT